MFANSLNPQLSVNKLYDSLAFRYGCIIHRVDQLPVLALLFRRLADYVLRWLLRSVDGSDGCATDCGWLGGG